MRKVLYILGQLDDGDVAWMAEVGRKRRLDAGVTLIREGETIENIYLVLDGHLRVEVAKLGQVAQLGVGEIVGEISFVDSAPPSATVVTDSVAEVLEISRAHLAQRLDDNDGFGHRFYKAMALFLADRLRNTVQRLGYGDTGELDEDEVMADELDDTLLDSVSLAGDRFDQLLKSLRRAPTAD